MSRVIVYLRKGILNKEGKSPIQLHVHLKGKKIPLSTGVYVNPNDWSKDKSVMQGSSKEAKDNNLIIKNCVSRVNDIFVRYKLQNKDITPDLLKIEYSKPSIFIDFYQFWERELELRKGENEPATIKAHRSALTKMKDYRKSLMFSEINEEFIRGFYNHMIIKLKNKNSTAAKTLTILKAYLRLAVRKKLLTESPFPEGMRIKKGVADRVYLTPDEFKTLVGTYRSNHLPENLQKTLRYFLFSCCTGLRISDVKAITWKNISEDVLIYSPAKTRNHGKIVRVPLIQFARELAGEKREGRNEVVFETYADQVNNRYLKNIADLTGIDKKITSHTGRHTFATIYLRHSNNLVGLKELLVSY